MCTHWALAREAAPPFEPPAPAPLPEQRTDGGAAQGAAPEPPHLVRAHRAAAHRVVTRVPRANQPASGVAEALRRPKVEEPVQEAVSVLGEPRIAAQIRIGDQPERLRWAVPRCLSLRSAAALVSPPEQQQGEPNEGRDHQADRQEDHGTGVGRNRKEYARLQWRQIRPAEKAACVPPTASIVPDLR